MAKRIYISKRERVLKAIELNDIIIKTLLKSSGLPPFEVLYFLQNNPFFARGIKQVLEMDGYEVAPGEINDALNSIIDLTPTRYARKIRFLSEQQVEDLSSVVEEYKSYLSRHKK